MGNRTRPVGKKAQREVFDALQKTRSPKWNGFTDSGFAEERKEE
jgi:hypothetical protein